VNAPTRVLLDTSVLIDASHRRNPAYDRLRGTTRSAGGALTSVVCVAEFLVGVPDPDREEALRFLATIPAADVTFEVAALAAAYRRRWLRQGTDILLPDALIAATAVVAGATLVTGNVKHFPMEELRVMSPADALRPE
jgi:predicted nucleic acid-binding protein